MTTYAPSYATLSGRQIPMRAPAVPQAPQAPVIPGGLLGMMDAGPDGMAAPGQPGATTPGSNLVGGSNWGTWGGLLGGLAGPAGSIAGTAAGVGYDVNRTNRELEALGLPGSVSYGPALAADMSMGMFGEGVFDQGNKAFMGAYDTANPSWGPYDGPGDGGGGLLSDGPDMGGWGSGSGGMGDIGSAW